jgi:uncharacterized protein YndB with AHSA1/START domain
MNDLQNPAIATARDTVRLERLLPGPIERVWSYLTDARKRATWFAGGEFELRPGGKAELVFDHRNLSSEPIPAKYANESVARCDCRVVRCEPPRLLSFDWKWGEEDSRVTFELAPQGDKVLLTVTHARLPTRKDMVQVASGWDAHVGILADLLEGKPARPFWATHARLEKDYEARL